MNGLKIYQWDWIEDVKDTVVSKFGTIGFMADEVKEKFPEFIGEFGGFMTINYSGLLDKLEGTA